MSDFDQALQTFFEESREMLVQIEDALLVLESGAADAETLNSLFRAAHTIKGSAGLFGFDAVVAFTHEVETVLDRLRAGELAFSRDLAGVLLASTDHVAAMLSDLERGSDGSTGDARGQALIDRLRALQGLPTGAPGSAATVVETVPAAGDGHAAWHVHASFGPDVFRSGMDPISFVRYLGTKGELLGVMTRLRERAEGERFDAESCYLDCDIWLLAGVTRDDLADAFAFVQDDCTLAITRAGDDPEPWFALARERPGMQPRVAALLEADAGIVAATFDRQLQAAAEAGPFVTPAAAEQAAETAATASEDVKVALVRQKEQRAEEARFIRVQADKLDELISLVGELVIAGAGASLTARQIRHSGMMEATQSISDLVEEIRNSALQLRMVQIGDTFSRFRRVVRDVSQDLGKDIELEIRGADTELDKSVVEKIADPLMHLVRNAMDHGIEPPEARVAAGKPRTGRLRLNAFHDSGSIVIEVTDDGRGMNRDRILQKAWERGILPPNTDLPDHEVFGLVFMPGFSTAETVTNLSGRGVGMDVVKRNIEALRGTVTVASTAGAGTTLSIRLPLTLAIIDGFLVGVGGASYVIPLDMVVECIDLPPEVPETAGHFNLRGQVLPFLRMREVFHVEGPPAVHRNVVVVRNGAARAGLLVDRLVGELQAVIKPLGRLFRDLQGIGGSTILGSGEVALILDVPALIARATRNSVLRGNAPAPARQPATRDAASSIPLLEQQ